MVASLVHRVRIAWFIRCNRRLCPGAEAEDAAQAAGSRAAADSTAFASCPASAATRRSASPCDASSTGAGAGTACRVRASALGASAGEYRSAAVRARTEAVRCVSPTDAGPTAGDFSALDARPPAGDFSAFDASSPAGGFSAFDAAATFSEHHAAIRCVSTVHTGASVDQYAAAFGGVAALDTGTADRQLTTPFRNTTTHDADAAQRCAVATTGSSSVALFDGTAPHGQPAEHHAAAANGCVECRPVFDIAGRAAWFAVAFDRGIAAESSFDAAYGCSFSLHRGIAARPSPQRSHHYAIAHVAEHCVAQSGNLLTDRCTASNIVEHRTFDRSRYDLSAWQPSHSTEHAAACCSNYAATATSGSERQSTSDCPASESAQQPGFSRRDERAFDDSSANRQPAVGGPTPDDSCGSANLDAQRRGECPKSPADYECAQRRIPLDRQWRTARRDFEQPADSIVHAAAVCRCKTAGSRFAQ